MWTPKLLERKRRSSAEEGRRGIKGEGPPGPRKAAGIALKASSSNRGFVPRGECALDAERACYQISLELPVPIDLVHLRSSSSLDLLEDGADATAVVSTCEPDSRHDLPGKPPTKLLASFRCQDDQHALGFVSGLWRVGPGTCDVSSWRGGSPRSVESSISVPRFVYTDASMN